MLKFSEYVDIIKRTDLSDLERGHPRLLSASIFAAGLTRTMRGDAVVSLKNAIHLRQQFIASQQ